jgi:hypothetical protein
MLESKQLNFIYKPGVKFYLQRFIYRLYQLNIYY